MCTYNNILRKVAVSALTLALCSNVEAQEFRTSYFMSTSDFRHQMNPALLDSAYVGIPVMGNIGIGVTGNIGLKNFVYKTAPGSKYDYTTFMSPDVSASEFLGDLHDNNRADLYLNLNIASVAFKAFNGMNLVELNVRSNTNIALPYSLFEFMKKAGEKEHYSIDDLGVRSQNYLELALGHSHQITDRLKVGGKMKFLVGVGYADAKVEKLNLTMNGDEWKVDGEIRAKAALLDSKFEYDSPDKNSPDGRRRIDGIDISGFGIKGFGLAFDLGATYRVMDGLTVSAALTDLGFISWNDVMKASSAGEYTFDGFDNIYVSGENEDGNKLGDQFERMGDDLKDIFAVYDDGDGSETTVLAATLNLGAEYEMPFYKPLRVGLLYTGRFNGLYTYHQAMLSANVRPVKWFEASVNTSLGSTGCSFGGVVNFRARHFNIFIGSDKFLGKVSKEFIPLNSCNASVNLGMSIPL